MCAQKSSVELSTIEKHEIEEDEPKLQSAISKKAPKEKEDSLSKPSKVVVNLKLADDDEDKEESKLTSRHSESFTPDELHEYQQASDKIDPLLLLQEASGRRDPMAKMLPPISYTKDNAQLLISCCRRKEGAWKLLFFTFNKYCTTIILFSIIGVYLLIGAYAFPYFEGEAEMERMDDARAENADAMDAILNILTNQASLSSADAMDVRDQLTDQYYIVGNNTGTIYPKAFWNNTYALFFSTTVLTTIGMFGCECHSVLIRETSCKSKELGVHCLTEVYRFLQVS